MPSQFEKRKAKTTKKIETPELPPVEHNYTRMGHDVFFDSDKRCYIIVDIEYDIDSGAARIKEIRNLADSQPVATYKTNEIFTKKILNLK